MSCIVSATISIPNRNGWLRGLFSGQPHQLIGAAGRPYLLRWFLIPPNRWCNIYWHRFVGSDEPVPHNHPWPFMSIVLRGSYIEVGSDGRPARRRAGHLGLRRAEHRHYVVLETVDGSVRPCTTIIVTGRRSRPWGFWCAEDQFVPWHEFGPGGCGQARP